MREERQQAIRRAIDSASIGTQQELRDALAAAGFPVDQSTLSRDLRELGVHKARGRYVWPQAAPAGPPAEPDYGAAVLGFLPCGPHLIVVRTAVGQAQPVALSIDVHGDAAIVATLAGDDTIFIATKTQKTQAVALRRLTTWFGDKRER
jgi:transcriptional regulator of arginine metabolism